MSHPLAGVADALLSLVLADEPLEACLHLLTEHALRTVPSGTAECGVFLLRPRKRPLVVASTTDAANLARRRASAVQRRTTLDQDAAPAGRPDAVDVDEYPERERMGPGVQSVLEQIRPIGEDSHLGICLYPSRPSRWGPLLPQVAADIAALHDVARTALAFGVRLSLLSGRSEDLVAASASRTRINIAAGILMEQSRCSHAEAIEILQSAASHRNMKMHALVEVIINSVQTPPGERNHRSTVASSSQTSPTRSPLPSREPPTPNAHSRTRGLEEIHRGARWHPRVHGDESAPRRPGRELPD
ncbi:ANTAR domain-containing protein [Arthrobacter agilis]|uniref:ANTAR domain-containing protein n=1 Tax=Arthrobacter agilis TaxID=37921 RepID=UPI002789CFE4|nr:GAF and ANTAR domain-containing protein [Arthrobacter agilis]MDQ0734959.1 hypothetical protein [Arthrobacter agilis]